ncbi:MAG: lycopene cyclase domain-containing protein [Gemmatimonadetes bacterium]|nr:lycopene cyclase domain-containing protein [Gemmatimonadota bacterium]
MTYLEFHLVFILPPLLLLLALRPWRRLGRGAGKFIPLLALIAFIYTTPWDNYLVWRGVWGYGSERVIGTIGYVPIEEYLFFLLQPLLTGLWFYLVLGRVRSGATSPKEADGTTVLVRVWGTLAYLSVAAVGALMLATTQGTYMGLILAWAAPVLAAQWAYAGHMMLQRLRAMSLGILVPTLYLWFADAVAIRLGIWDIAEQYTYGPRPLGLPIEEAVFFLVTNVLVVQGLVLFLYPPSDRNSTAGRQDMSAKAPAGRKER